MDNQPKFITSVGYDEESYTDAWQRATEIQIDLTAEGYTGLTATDVWNTADSGEIVICGAKPVVLVNYSHPLTEKAKGLLSKMIGRGIREVVIPCQIDMEATIGPQLDALVDSAPGVIDLYIPPSLSFAAAYVTARLSYAQSDAAPPQPPTMVIMARIGTPTQFLPIEIV